MHTLEAILKIDTFTLGHLTKLLRHGDPERQKSTLYDEEVTFPDGTRMAIQVCPGDDGEGNSAPWTQGVLFTSCGNEIGCTEPGEEILGEYRVERDDGLSVAYVCHVTPEDLIWESLQPKEVRTITYPVDMQEEAMARIDWDEGWRTIRMGPILIGPGQFSARLGQLVIERDVGPPQ